jgi:P4 family phage/plasmid primase-like protien
VFKIGFKPDYGFHNNAWLLYGASKKDSHLYYKLDYFLDSKLEKIELAICQKSYINLFWLYPSIDNTIYYINYYEQIEPNEEEIESEDDSDDLKKEKEEQAKMTETEKIEYMLYTLAQNRVEESSSWFGIVAGCKNYGEEMKLDLRHILRDWSQTTTQGNFCEEGFNRVWNKETKYTIKTLYKFWYRDNGNFMKILKGTDDALAKLISNEFKGQIVLVSDEIGYIYDEETTLWSESQPFEIYNKALPFLKDQVRKTWVFLKKKEKWVGDDKEKQKKHKETIAQLNKTSIKIENAPARKSVINALTTYIYNKTFEESLNKHKFLFPIKNNLVVNLKTGETYEREQKHFFTWESPVNILRSDPLHGTERTINDSLQLAPSVPAELACANKWFLDIANGDTDLASYLKTLLLYFCSGGTFDRSFYQLIGEGKNGKSLFINILEVLLGVVCITGKKKTIITTKYKNEAGAEPEICRMRGKRLVTFTETGKNDLLNNESLKSLTGGDKQTARMLYSNTVSDFKMTAKMLIATNYQLEFFENDEALKCRCKVIPFNNTFEPNEQFTTDILENKENKLSAIFSVALEDGKIHLQKKEKFTAPEAVLMRTKEVCDEMDTVLNFIRDECDTDVSGNKDGVRPKEESAISTTKLFSCFQSYCIRNKYPVPSDKFFSKEMEKKNFTKKRINNITKYFGITISQEITTNSYGIDVVNPNEIM